MKRVLTVLLVLISGVVMSQEDISGIWILKKQISIKGPNYNNGLPSVIRIAFKDNEMSLTASTQYDGKETIDTQKIQLTKEYNEFLSTANRIMKVNMKWEKGDSTWVRYTQMSAQDKNSKPEITILEKLKLANAGLELFIYKKYESHDRAIVNKDYIMQGVYTKTTDEEIVKKTAKGKGIRFTNNISWNQLLEKARKEGKFIFVDCYATWCAPCKKMDKEIFALNMVGDAINDQFIAVKIQMDTSKMDDDNVRQTYAIARYLEKEFDITSLPTFLFFAPDGKPVHKAVGAYSGEDFIQLAQNAKNPSAQIFTLIGKAEKKKLLPGQMRLLADKLYKSGDKSLATRIARLYFEQYLYKLNEDQFFKKDNIDFYIKYSRAIKSSDPIFSRLLSNPEKLDSFYVFRKGFTTNLVESVIANEEMHPFDEKSNSSGTAPDWEMVHKRISKKFSPFYADRIVVNSKVAWFRKAQLWDEYITNLVLQVEMINDLNLIHWSRLNSAAWDVFKYSNNKMQLEKAVRWSEVAIKNHTQDSTIKEAPWGSILDTYANLLYKLGRKEEAIKFYQDKILSVGLQNITLYETYIKMFKGEPTWPQVN